MSRFRMWSMTGTCIAALGVASPALAQAASEQQVQSANPQAVEANNARDDEVIVVTAQKRKEAILDIPQSVTVVSGETLERQQATTFEQYLNQIPGLSITESEPGSTRLTLRGVNTGGVSSTVAVYVDEMPFGSSSGLVNGAILTGDIDPFDIARIEVLRGPQGTLYGANSLGGIFKYVSNEPKLGELSGRARAGVEFVDDGGTGYNANGLINAPLGDKAAFRASGFYRKRAGWVDALPQDVNFLSLFDPSGNTFVTARSIDDNNINGNESYGGRASVLFQPSEPLTIRLTAYLQNLKTHGSSNVEVDPDDLDPINGEYDQTNFVPEFNDVTYRIFNATVDYDFGFANLVSATSYGKLKTDFRTEATLALAGAFNSVFGPLSPFPGGIPGAFPAQITTDTLGVAQDQVTGLKKFTQELRLASPSNNRFEWMVGAYYTKEEGVIDQHINGVVLANPGELEDELTDLLFARVDSTYKEYAGFANATWHATDRFDITAGARWSHNKQDSSQVVGGPFAPLQFGAIPDFEDGHSSESVFTYSLSPRFELSDNTAVYARIAKGYRPGGPNAVPPLSSVALETFPTTYDADTLTSYEVGLKHSLGRRFSFDLAAYHLKWDNIQVFGAVNSFGFNANGGGAIVNGLEGSLNVRPMRGLNLSVNGAWMDAELTEDTLALVGGEDGDTLPYTPKFSFAINADYEWTLSSIGNAYVGGSLRYVGTQRAGFRSEFTGEVVDEVPIFAPLPQRKIPDFATLDLRAGVDFGKYSVEAFARNVTNSHGITSLDEATGIPGGGNYAAFIQPRTIGLTLTAGFRKGE
ncbi:MAG: TonB-dependent receptor [Sphingomicrobium sp.]